MKNWIDISSGPIDTPDVASHCIALRCNLRSLHVPSRPIPYLSLISTWNSSLFEWYKMLHCNAFQPQSCIALHCSPRYLHVPYPAFISTWILSIFETLSYPTDIIFKSPWPCQPVQPLSKCESISSKSLWPFQTTQPWQSFQTCQKGFDPFSKDEPTFHIKGNLSQNL